MNRVPFTPFNWSDWRRAFGVGTILALASWFSCQAALELGHHFVAPGEAASGVDRERDLFRFDSFYYRAIAEQGYSYDGHLDSSPNIVFAPLFPWSAAALAGLLNWGTVTAGFILNSVCFWLALILIFKTLSVRVGERAAMIQLSAFVLAPGSYAFHAFYSESIMLLGFSFMLFSFDQEQETGAALATACLGLSRMAMAPVIAFVAFSFCWTPVRQNLIRRMALAAVSLSGMAGFLIFLGLRYGNPFTLLPQIQSVSWGRFHQPAVGWWWGEPLWTYTLRAFDRSFWEIRTLNLLWTWAALGSCVYALVAFGRTRFAWVFVLYVVFIYYQIAGSEYLISAHRLFIFVLPIYMMFGALHRQLARVSRGLAWGVTAPLWILNWATGLFMIAHFNQGDWFYF